MIRRYHIIVLWVLLLTPELALAHSPIEGINSFYNGVLHPFFVPAHLLQILALGLYFGQLGQKRSEGALRLFLVATLVGLIIAMFGTITDAELVLLSGAAICGLLIAAHSIIGKYWITIIAAVAGFTLGVDSAQESLSGWEEIVSLLGSGVGILLLLGSPMVIVDTFNEKAWHRIGVRVVGSWLAASALLVLALSFSSRP
jgi:urease accessory protein